MSVGERLPATGESGQVGAAGVVNRSRRITFLEGVRGVAASIVVIQHLFAENFPGYAEWTHDHLDFGRVGVVAFFLVSGYVIPLSLAGQTLPGFATRRFFRLYPVYWLAFAAFAVVELIVRGSLEGATLPVVVLNILMLHGLIGAVSLLPPAWTLSIELLYYVQSAAAKSRRLLDQSVHFGWFWLGFYVLLCVGERITGKDLPTTLPMLLFLASLGHAIHLRDAAGRRIWAVMLAAGAVFVPLGAYIGVDGDGEWPPFTYSFSFLVGIALFFAFYLLRNRGMARPLIFLGAISYAVYLMHPILMEAFHDLHGYTSVVVVGASTLLLGYLVHRFVEKPSIEVGRRASARFKTAGRTR
ncbi:acyltransferase [Actinoplanes sp. NPDC026619]|uniref:acyltransferase family protein n=1 Tax=Actinoplanes sp. NPDC026619 TaxID=3155798 RepID=UPI0033F3F1F1